MESLKEVINCLNRTEVCAIKSNFRLQEGKSKGKRLRLFELVRANRVTTDEQAAEILYEAKPNAAYSNLKHRVKQSILDFILSKQSQKKQGEESLSEARIECWRLLTLAQILVRRNAHLEALKVLSLTEELIAQYEMKTERVVLEELYQSDSILTTHRSASNFSVQMLSGYLLEVQYLIEAKAACNELERAFVSGVELCGVERQKISDSLTSLWQINEMEQNCVVGYWSNYLASLYSRMIGDDRKAVGYAEKVVQLTIENPQMYLEAQSINVRLLLAELYLRQGSPELMEVELIRIEHLLLSKTFQPARVAELRFKAAMFNKDLMAAGIYLSHGLKLASSADDCELEYRWQYHSAHWHFLQRNRKAALSALNLSLSGLPNGSSLSVSARILELMVLLESNSEELFEYRLEALHQFLKRHHKNSLQAYRRIIGMLKLLVRFEYDYQAIEAIYNNHINLCSEDEQGPFDQMLHDFNFWLSTKVRFGNTILVS